MTKKQPKYLIWYLFGEDFRRSVGKQKFVEHTNKRAWMWDVERLKKNPANTQIKYTEYYEQD